MLRWRRRRLRRRRYNGGFFPLNITMVSGQVSDTPRFLISSRPQVFGLSGGFFMMSTKYFSPFVYLFLFSGFVCLVDRFLTTSTSSLEDIVLNADNDESGF